MEWYQGNCTSEIHTASVIVHRATNAKQNLQSGLNPDADCPEELFCTAFSCSFFDVISSTLVMTSSLDMIDVADDSIMMKRYKSRQRKY